MNEEEYYFVEDENGHVHLLHAGFMDEGTLCFLGPDNPVLTNRNTRKKVVTCPRCIRIIEWLKKVKYREARV